MKGFGIAALWAMNAACALAADERPACLTAAIDHVNEGAFDTAVPALDECIGALQPGPPANAHDLADAYLYKAVALVGLRQEDAAKAAFRKVLEYDAAFEPSPERFSPQVIRVFRAARAGKNKSVIDRPNTSAKRAGLGASGIAAVAVGAVVIGGGAAALAQQNQGAPSPGPCPTAVPVATWIRPDARETISGTYRFQCALPAETVLKYASCGIRIGYYAQPGLLGFGTPPDFSVDVPTASIPNGEQIVTCAVWIGQYVSIGTVEPVIVQNPASTPTP